MKTKLLFMLAAIAASVITQKANAKIWRVNNNADNNNGSNLGGTAANPVFRQLQNANNSNLVSDGDTIHLEGSATAYDAATINKELIIIGPGYFLADNPKTSYNKTEAKLHYITFNNGAQGSQLIGLHVAEDVDGIDIRTSDIAIKRCLIDYDIELYVGISDISILENFFTSTNNILKYNINGFPTDVIINNNIIQGKLLLPNDPDYTVKECNNNTFDPPNGLAIELYAGTFQNNILTNPNSTVNINNGNFTHVSYNISASANNQFGTSNHNIVVTNMSKLFVNSESNDGQYQLKKDSPGSNNGSDGTDRGAFGGLPVYHRYTLSGLPPVPVIYELTTGVGTPENGLSVTISARTIK